MALGIYSTKFTLPHTPIPLSVFLVVEQALRLAWNLMLQTPRPGFNIKTANEDFITHELYETLVDKVFKGKMVAGFDSQLFRGVEREPKKCSYDYSSLDKMPDLLFLLVGRDVSILTQDGLYVECKPVDAAHTVGKHYCDKGISRFVQGEYAWAMTDALMIGYACDSYKIIPKLEAALRKRRNLALLGQLRECSHSIATPISQVVHISDHSRAFVYQQTKQKAPTITLRHLWLQRN